MQVNWIKNKFIISALVLIIIVFIFVIALFTNNGYKAEEVLRLCDVSNPCNVAIATDKRVYAQGEPVKVRITNDTAFDIQFDQSFFWQIQSGESLTVYRPEQIKAQGLLGASEEVQNTTLASGEYVEWIWLQNNVMSDTVGAGIYVARIVDPKFSGALTDAYFSIEGEASAEDADAMMQGELNEEET